MKSNRTAEVSRQTKETKVSVKINLDGQGDIKIRTGVGFFDHMLELMSFHGYIDMELEASGDTNVDYHHLVEDTGLVLGEAVRSGLGDKSGIERYSTVHLPMDEALVMIALDISGRPYLSYEVDFPAEKVGSFDVELVEEFLRAFAVKAGLTLHVRQISGQNCHHISEAIFKGLGRSLYQAVEIKNDSLPSTKGKL